ncbi:MAG TPA: alpha/beta hydrolase, partial [Hanamia sp.]
MKKKFMQWLLLAAVITYSAGCSKNQTLSSNTFVLVHGSWQAPYVWNTVKSELEKAGQKVIVVELPAHGNDFTS